MPSDVVIAALIGAAGGVLGGGGLVAAWLNYRLGGRKLELDSDEVIYGRQVKEISRLSDRVDSMDLRLKARDEELDNLQVEHVALQGREDQCQQKLRALARQFVKFRDRVKQHLPEMAAEMEADLEREQA